MSTLSPLIGEWRHGGDCDGTGVTDSGVHSAWHHVWFRPGCGRMVARMVAKLCREPGVRACAWRRFGAGVVAFVLVGAASGCGSDDEKSGSENDGSAGSTGDATGGGSSSGSGGAAGSTGGAAGSGALPEGNVGIAVQYPGDVGIDTDSAVLFADDFESYTQSSELDSRWTYFYQTQLVAITTDPANVYAGSQALEFTIPQQDEELSDGVDKDITPEQDVLHLRFYSKFMPPYDVVGSSHNGGGISAHYFGPNNQATPGVPADGTNKFLVNLENWRGEASTVSPGQLNVYVYHPEQRSQWGDHFYPTGLVNPNTSIPFDFGPDFVSRPDVIQDLDRWYCYELMVQANTPGRRDGRIAAWLDGALAMDFMNLRLRDVDTLTINRVGIGLHIGSNPNQEARKWYDNVVVATSYIGPMSPP